MKRIIYALSILLIVLVVACNDKECVPSTLDTDEGYVTLNINAKIPGYKEIKNLVRSGENALSKLNVLIFNDGGFLVEHVVADLTGTAPNLTYSAKIRTFPKQRSLHFIANYNFTDAELESLMRKSEKVVMKQIQSENRLFWAKVVKPKIEEPGIADLDIELLRSDAKIEVINSSTSNFELEGYVVDKATKTGMVAPRDFEFGHIAMPPTAEFIAATEDGINNDVKYVFENENEISFRTTTVIAKGKYNGEASSYYKIALIKKPNQLEIKRCYHYKIDIKSVARSGYPTLQEALDGLPVNDLYLAPEISAYPMVSDGTSELSVEKTLVVSTKASDEIKVWFRYIPDIAAATVDNSGVKMHISGSEGIVDESATEIDNTNGIVKIKIVGTAPDEDDKICKITLEDPNGKLFRTIRIVYIKPFDFTSITINDNPNPTDLSNTQNKDAKLKFTIPAEVYQELLPLKIKIHTNGLYYVGASPKLELKTEGKNIYYIYTTYSTGEQELHFKTSKAILTGETVKIESDIFNIGSISY